MQVPEDFVCEHGMPQPWATCTECMMLPKDEQPVPPKPKPKPKPEPPSRKRSAAASSRPTNREPRTNKAPRAPAARLPRHADDTMPELTGTFDLAYEVPDDNVSFHVHGPESSWMAISSFPTWLRPEGWVYLQVDADVVARARVRGVGYRDKRWSQEPSATSHDLGGGPTLELYPDSWERLRVWLGDDAEAPVKGYRYLVTESAEVVRVADAVTEQAL